MGPGPLWTRAENLVPPLPQRKSISGPSSSLRVVMPTAFSGPANSCVHRSVLMFYALLS